MVLPSANVTITLSIALFIDYFPRPPRPPLPPWCPPPPPPEEEGPAPSSPPTTAVRRIVLVDVDSVLAEERLWYDFRRVFRYPKGPEVRGISPQQMEIYRTAANFCVKSPKGGCSYDGYVYTGPLHLTKRRLHYV